MWVRHGLHALLRSLQVLASTINIGMHHQSPWQPAQMGGCCHRSPMQQHMQHQQHRHLEMLAGGSFAPGDTNEPEDYALLPWHLNPAGP